MCSNITMFAFTASYAFMSFMSFLYIYTEPIKWLNNCSSGGAYNHQEDLKAALMEESMDFILSDRNIKKMIDGSGVALIHLFYI